MDIEKLENKCALDIANIGCLPGGEDCLSENPACECRYTARAVLAIALAAAAEEAKSSRDLYVKPTDWDYGADNACIRLETRLRTLATQLGAANG